MDIPFEILYNKIRALIYACAYYIYNNGKCKSASKKTNGENFHKK